MPLLALKERNNIVSEHRLFVVRIAYKLQREFGLPKAIIADLKSAGFLGLIEAAGRFRPELGSKFSTYAYFRIRGAMIDEMRRTAGVPGQTYRAAKNLKALNEIFQEESIDQAADAESQLAHILENLSQGLVAHELSDATEEEELLDDSCQTALERNSESKFLKGLLNQLPVKQKIVLEQYYFQDRSFAEIAKRHKGMTKSWISRLHVAGLQNLKKLYETAWANNK